jgi:hypothetical protein
MKGKYIYFAKHTLKERGMFSLLCARDMPQYSMLNRYSNGHVPYYPAVIICPRFACYYFITMNLQD